MTSARLLGLVRRQVHRLSLCNWTIHLNEVDAPALSSDDEHDLMATIDWDYRSTLATLRVAMQRPDAEVTKSVGHELLHLVLAPVMHSAYEAIIRLAATEQTLARERLQDEEERAIRALERALEL